MIDDRSSVMEDTSHVFDVWRDIRHFLKQPSILGPPQVRDAFAVKQVGALLLLALLIAAAFILVFEGAEQWMGVQLPEQEYSPIDEMPGLFLLLAVILAPLIEETLFRLWLDGRPTHVKLVICILTWIVGLWLVAKMVEGPATWPVILMLTSLAVILGMTWIAKTRGQGTSELYRHVFPILFWVSAFFFGLAHLLNYAVADRYTALPLILSQTIGGVLLAYCRLRYGMWANISVHAAFNGVLVVIIFALE